MSEKRLDSLTREAKVMLVVLSAFDELIDMGLIMGDKVLRMFAVADADQLQSEGIQPTKKEITLALKVFLKNTNAFYDEKMLSDMVRLVNAMFYDREMIDQVLVDMKAMNEFKGNPESN